MSNRMERIVAIYVEYHTGSKISEESLVKKCREFLSAENPEDRFVQLNIDFYRNVLRKICQNENSPENNEETLQRIMRGFKSLEQYAIKLWKFPWRKEYHTIKLYTAYFKCNIEQQLKDTEVIFDLLKSLGYTVRKQQKVSFQDSEKQHPVYEWASASLYLVQVDLQVVKEIMDQFPNGEFTLKDIVRIRSKTSDVEDAVEYLRGKAKRRKIEEEPSDAPSNERTKDTHIGRVEVINNLQPETSRSDAVTSADQNTRRPAKLSVLSKGRGDVAADSDDSLTGAESKRHTSAGTSTGYNIPSRTTGGRYFASMNTLQFAEHDLYGVSPQAGQQQHNSDARYSTAPQAGTRYDATKYASDSRYSTFPQTGSLYDANQPALDALYDTSSRARAFQLSGNKKENLRYHTEPKDGNPPHYDNIQYRMDAATTSVTVTPSHSSHQQANRSYRGFVSDDMWRNSAASQNVTVAAMTTNNGNQDMTSTRTATQKHGSSRDARYANPRDISSSADQQFRSTNPDEPVSTKDNMRRLDDIGVKDGRARHSSSELKKVEQREPFRGSRNDASQYYNGATEQACERSAAQSGITDLDSTLKHHLTLDPEANLAGKESTKKVSGTSTEGIATRSRDRITKEAQSSRPLYQYESNFTATKEVGKDTGSSAADITSHSAKKIQSKGSSPVPLRKTSTKEDWSQNPARSSKNDADTKASQKAMAHQTNVKADTICHHCLLQGTIICKNCFRILCRKCKYIYTTDHCDATKGDHAFVDIRDNIRHQMKFVDSKASSSQHYANVNESFGDWPCTRCTYLNPPDHGICVMCAASRGVSAEDDPKPGSKVCRNCTLNNEEGAKVCVACDKTLCNSETVV